MNKIKLLLIAIITALLIPNVNAASLNEYINESTGYKVIVEDDAELLTIDELKLLQQEMIPLTEYGNIIFKTLQENYTHTEKYASDYYHDRFGSSSGTIFVIDMDNRLITIFSDGSNYNIITDNKATIITDNIYNYATNEEYYECASQAFSQILTLLKGGKISEPMRHITNALLSITIAFFISFIIVLIKTSIKKPSLDEKMKNCNVKFNISNISASKTGTHRVYSPQSSSSGGSSGGVGGGGGSSGGGGSHGF